MRWLLDADWIISYLNGRAEAVDLVDRLSGEGLAVAPAARRECPGAADLPACPNVRQAMSKRTHWRARNLPGDACTADVIERYL